MATENGGTMKLVRLAAVALIAVFATVVGLAPVAAQTASAAPVVPLVKCRSMQSESNSLVSPVELSGCNRPRVTGGLGTSFTVGPDPFPIAWATGKQTNYNCPFRGCGTSPFIFQYPGRCPTSLMEFDAAGTIATVSGPWTRRFIGDTVTYDICVTRELGVDELVPGTAFMIIKP